MIHGLTTRTQLAIASKFAIGLPKSHKDYKSYPQKLDYFMAETKNAKGEWVEDDALCNLLREKYSRKTDQGFTPLREFDVVFLSDDIEEVFKTEYAMWSASEKQCSGDGLKAARALSIIKDKAIVDAHQGQRYMEWEPCGDTCPEHISKKCKPSGALYFMLLDKPVIGVVNVFFTTSYRTVLQIHSSLEQIKQLTGGRLRGIPLRVVMRPGKTSYEDPKTKERKTSNAFFVNVEFRQADHTKLLPALMDASVQYERAKIGQVQELKRIGAPVKMLTEFTDGDVIDELPEAETAQHMAGHFFTDTDNDEPEETGAVDTAAIDTICKSWNISQARRDVVLGTFGGDVQKTTAWFEAVSKHLNRLNAPQGTVDGIFAQLGMQPGVLLERLGNMENPQSAPAAPASEPPRRQRRTKEQMAAANTATTQTAPPAAQPQPDPAPAKDMMDGWTKPEPVAAAAPTAAPAAPKPEEKPQREIDPSTLSF